MAARFEVYQDVAGRWRWRLLGHDDRQIASAAEMFASEQAAVEGVQSIFAEFGVFRQQSTFGPNRMTGGPVPVGEYEEPPKIHIVHSVQIRAAKGRGRVPLAPRPRPGLRLAPRRTVRPAIHFQRITESLGLTDAELAALFDTDGAQLSGWLRGDPMPDDRAQRLNQLLGGLVQLLRMFEPARLPEVVRRPTPAFGGRTPLEAIASDGIESVVEAYERLLRYSP